MSYFKAKMHQIRFHLGLCPRPRWGSLQHSQTPQLDLRGPASKGREGKQGKGEGKERKVVHPAPQFFLYFFEYFGRVITYIGNHGNRSEYGSEKQFK